MTVYDETKIPMARKGRKRSGQEKDPLGEQEARSLGAARERENILNVVRY